MSDGDSLIYFMKRGIDRAPFDVFKILPELYSKALSGTSFSVHTSRSL